jgi:hypothetical protein
VTIHVHFHFRLTEKNSNYSPRHVFAYPADKLRQYQFDLPFVFGGLSWTPGAARRDCDEDKERFEELLGKIARHKTPKELIKKEAKKSVKKAKKQRPDCLANGGRERAR